MIDQSTFRAAYARAFPQATDLPRDAATLESQILQARENGVSGALVVFDRLVAGLGARRLAQLLGGDAPRVSEGGRQQAADLVGRGDPRALYRPHDLSAEISAMQQLLPARQLRELVNGQLLRATSNTPGKDPLFRNSAVFLGSAVSTRAAAMDYASALHALGIVKSPDLVHLELDGRRCGDNARDPQASLTRRVSEAFATAKSNGGSVLFIDLATAKEWHTATGRDAEIGERLLVTLARSLVAPLSRQVDGNVVVAGDAETLRALNEREEGLERRLGNVVRIEGREQAATQAAAGARRSSLVMDHNRSRAATQLAQRIAAPGHRDLILAQITDTPRDKTTAPLALYRRSAAFAGDPEDAKASAQAYARTLFALEMIDTPELATVSVTETDVVRRYVLGERQAELITTMRRAFRDLERGDSRVLFIDASYAERWRMEDPVNRHARIMLETLAQELIRGLSEGTRGNVVFSANRETIRALCGAQAGLARRLGDTISV